MTLPCSSVEVEYRVVANAVAETYWLRNLLRELHTPLSSATLVYCDNVSVVYLSSNPVQYQRTKHIEIDIHFVRDLVAAGQVQVLHVPSRYQLGYPADQVLDVLKTALNLDSHSTYDYLCDTCKKAKQTREPFPLSDHRSTKIRQLVHLDVWGPYKGNDNSEATSIEENNTHHEGNDLDETDFVVNGVERVVNYVNISHENFCFASSLNKSVEPTCYNDVIHDAILDNNWIDVMNAELKL
ncbi:ribonuclease H-like domain-containing protein [Tanacetum coccineum]